MGPAVFAAGIRVVFAAGIRVVFAAGIRVVFAAGADSQLRGVGLAKTFV
ncbi:Uncharacterised protein [Legionella birminghamensis]|uniref:Uncharacterized protein n=1 Tax=Legionella birminghamensis TaxID=28083 RepID=A0A378I8U1_9GAMM|nr:Uncharacterised protein [Legionella birminghamensis]